MKKKGFTLVELLAVIVILAVISLIAIPMILNVIENAKKGSAEASANAYKEALTQLIAENEIKGVNKLQTNNTYYVTRGTTIGGTYYEAINDIIKIKGYKPTGYDDYIKFGKHYEIEEAVLTINGYEIKLEDNKVVAVEKGEIIELEYITVTETETMERGSSYTIETIFEPINTSDQRIKYTSSNNSIVTVDENGLVKAIKNGEAKITVTPLSNKSLKKEITITVISPSEVTGIKLNKESTIIGLGKSEDIIATLEPSDATSNALTWESNNDVVSVSDSGKITGTKLGTSIVTATTQSGLKTSIEVTVEYEITLNNQKYYTANDNITIDNVDTTNKTNISCNNGSIPSINGNNVTITNITSSVECVINDSLKETVDNIDSSLNNILMINDEINNNESIVVGESKNINLDLNGNSIVSNTTTILNKGNLIILGDGENSILSSTGYNSKTIYNSGFNAKLIIKGGHYISTTNCDAWYCSTIYNDNSSNLEILPLKETVIDAGIYKSGVYIEQTYGIGVWLTGNSTAKVNGGQYKVITKDNAEWQSFVCSGCNKLTINNAKVIGNGSAIRGQKNGNIVVNNGFYQTNRETVTTDRDFEGEITINGGNFISDFEAITNYGTGNINVNKGYFKSNRTSGLEGVIENNGLGNININGKQEKIICTDNYNDYIEGVCINSKRNSIINLGKGNIVINGVTAIAGTQNVSNWYGNAYINSGYFYTDGSGVLSSEGIDVWASSVIQEDFDGTINILGGDFESTTGYTIRNYGSGTINIKGGNFKSNQYATILNHSDNNVIGNINICNGNIQSGTYDLATVNSFGNISYSKNVNFTNGTNTPITIGNNIINNYTGACE